MSKPHAIIIGAGFTGTATAHELALRGFDVTVVERGNFVSGTSGRTHGLLHSGGRYCVKDQESAIECIEENYILRKIVPDVIEPNGGLFVAFDEQDLAYEETFIKGTQECGIPIDELTKEKTLALEPNLNPKMIKAYLVPDGTFDPLRLALAFAATAKSNGAEFLLYHEVESLIQDGNGNVVGVKVWDRTSNQRNEIRGDIVVSATGVWAGKITAMVGGHVPIQPTPGVMVAFDQRLIERTINRLRKSSDGDIILPQRQMPGRSLSRTFKCFDHKETDNIDGFVTITGGKATTCRGMAEQTANVVCDKLGISVESTSKEVPLLSYRKYYTL